MDTENEVMYWKELCDLAKKKVNTADNQRGDCAIDAAKDLMAQAIRLKGVECRSCRGYGTRTYGSSSTWQGGGSGCVATEDVCDNCWGTGRTDRKGQKPVR